MFGAPGATLSTRRSLGREDDGAESPDSRPARSSSVPASAADAKPLRAFHCHHAAKAIAPAMAAPPPMSVYVTAFVPAVFGASGGVVLLGEESALGDAVGELDGVVEDDCVTPLEDGDGDTEGVPVPVVVCVIAGVGTIGPGSPTNHGENV